MTPARYHSYDMHSHKHRIGITNRGARPVSLSSNNMLNVWLTSSSNTSIRGIRNMGTLLFDIQARPLPEEGVDPLRVVNYLQVGRLKRSSSSRNYNHSSNHHRPIISIIIMVINQLLLVEDMSFRNNRMKNNRIRSVQNGPWRYEKPVPPI
jgi:hypothetical protein